MARPGRFAMECHMAYFPWQDFLSSGIDAMDAAHREQLDLLNRLADPAARGDQAVFRETLDLLAQHLDSHIAAEEQTMADSGYLFAERHRRRHQEQRKTLEMWRERAASGWWPWQGGSFHIQAMNSFVRHIVEEDHPFAAFLQTGRIGRSRLAA